MTEKSSEIIFLIDRSGSMNVCEEDTIGGYNSFLDIQRREEGRAYVTTVLFDNHYEVLCEHADISEAVYLSGKEYYARGTTALLDAIGLTISRVSQRQKAENGNAKTLMVIITDGQDNVSRVYSVKDIYEMIHEQQDHNGWQFIFLGADMESIRTARSIGISPAQTGSFTKANEGVRQKFSGISRTVSHFRKNGQLNQDWRI